MGSCRGIKVDVDRCSSFVGDESSSVVETIGAKSRGAVWSTGGREEGAKSCAGGGVLKAPAAIEDVLTSLGVCGVPFEGEKSEAELCGGGILPILAASDSCLLLTSASEVEGPDENLFFNVPRKPSFVGCLVEFRSVDSEALVLTD